MNQNVVTYTVVVNTDNTSGRLIPYLTADLQFEVARHSKVLLVPNAALRWQPSPERVAAAGLPQSRAGTERAEPENVPNKKPTTVPPRKLRSGWPTKTTV